jgi:hypothetical protein
MSQACPECGKIGGEQRFCKYCGALLVGDAPAPVMLRPPPARKRGGRLAAILAVSVLCLAAIGFWLVKLNQTKPRPGGKSESRGGSVQATAPGAVAPAPAAVASQTPAQIDQGPVGAKGTPGGPPHQPAERRTAVGTPGGAATNQFKTPVDESAPNKPVVANAAPQNLPAAVKFFTAFPDSSAEKPVPQCQLVVFSWPALGGPKIYINGRPWERPYYEDRPSQTTTYDFEAKGTGEPVRQSVTVYVAPGNRTGCRQ